MARRTVQQIYGANHRVTNSGNHTRPESDNLVDQRSEIAQADPNNRKELTKTEIVHL